MRGGQAAGCWLDRALSLTGQNVRASVDTCYAKDKK